ncbi:MAG: NAD-binding protein [Actinobacteria bacterium]|nr:NAD-binding protein [Actinomycetota bacterium]
MPRSSFEQLLEGQRLPAQPSRALVRREFGYFLRRLAVAGLSLAILMVGGATAYSRFEGETWWKGFIRAFETVTTLGASGSPVSLGGQITEIVVISLGLGTLLYLLGTITELLVTGHLNGLLQARRMQKRIEDLHDHYLICGFGRVGHQIARRLAAAGVPFVVIDENPDVREDMEQMGLLHVDGRASDDDVLCEAGIMRARAVITCVDSDAENIFVTITARALRPDIEIVARAAEEPTERKLIRAGANDIVSPYKASGDAMARLALDVGGARDAGRPVDVDADGRPEGRIADLDPAS